MKFTHALKWLSSPFVPARCVICNEDLEIFSLEDLCDVCMPKYVVKSKDENICYSCGEESHCLAIGASEETTCYSCMAFPMPVRQLRSMFSYDDGQIKKLITTFKYRGSSSLANVISKMFANYILQEKTFTDKNWDLIVHLPSSPCSTKKRGFEHMSLVARALSKQIHIPHLPFAVTAVRSRSPQVELKLLNRPKNLKNAFYVSPRLVQGKTILLCDDVLTSGASIFSLTKQLLRAGAKEVDVLTLARSSRFLRYRIRTSAFKEMNSQSIN